MVDKNLLQTFSTITLDEMKSVRLMNRIDTKFVTTTARLLDLLQMASANYRLQSANGKVTSTYSTIYYDTPDHRMFYTHQAGVLSRQKLRFRTYVDSNLTFLEVKTKNNHRRTKKKRITASSMQFTLPEQYEFARRHLQMDVESLQPTLENTFERITLVNKALTERLTIDTNILSHSLLTDCQSMRDNLVVIELKRDALTSSPILDVLRSLRIFPHGYSKYCMGQATTNPSLRLNRFKEKLREIDIIIR